MRARWYESACCFVREVEALLKRRPAGCLMPKVPMSVSAVLIRKFISRNRPHPKKVDLENECEKWHGFKHMIIRRSSHGGR